jgi:hypothetical protein
MSDFALIYNKLIDLENKYESLVWYARKTDQQINSIPKVKQYVLEVQKLYPNECNELNTLESSDWSNGFNSGMLACVRYLQDIIHDGKEVADENFPSLDS